MALHSPELLRPSSVNAQALWADKFHCAPETYTGAALLLLEWAGVCLGPSSSCRDKAPPKQGNKGKERDCSATAPLMMQLQASGRPCPCRSAPASRRLLRCESGGLQVYCALTSNVVVGMGLRPGASRPGVLSSIATNSRYTHTQADVRSGRGSSCRSACRGTKEGEMRLLSFDWC